MINVSATKQKATRTTKAKLRLFIDGEMQEKEVRVIYESMTIKDAREVQETATLNKETEKVYFLSEILLNNYNLKRLPDFENDEGKEVEVTIELLEDFDLYNLKAIQKAILEDSDPK